MMRRLTKWRYRSDLLCCCIRAQQNFYTQWSTCPRRLRSKDLLMQYRTIRSPEKYSLRLLDHREVERNPLERLLNLHQNNLQPTVQEQLAKKLRE